MQTSLLWNSGSTKPENEKGAVSMIGTAKKALYNKKLMHNNEHTTEL